MNRPFSTVPDDPLEIGTAFMATCSAAFSIRGEGESR